ncbi:Plant invertase/pectin methylesterase inhibitor superfamily [Arabidopsis thaliana]|uniref:Probable pectinesterase/pectinesterase inhibitor 54 n=1 Tax=Arabidopsis thaliana TaxID=3702 RepID=PME54_ARATH|nr:Plant invertase/pectin methylesterase inhibitor superfamily [Arabidopsis thaliana]Q3E989.1 RecName: Full=Probable pectinesterase/pectinesterase inhibitor 54; Includes: RecName: Full=Pectinesterase inhibitor 54; AltName: Full=Pectin methylesterase inhibitor 54; Includes: RecName: Full=Pectinesterase 54; Short=PE 54; AltName: Full=Pectin methylesterase 54; Short=AtPME54; Flags: Precursor [Arabidopsis thaliana]AED92898.1 Plant invertase/pectin methylesterase inhibitor superfamily [Arabidopsis tha|eukprot:NP_197586.1 Plant invertase/pectin methylesterase inhibitor superfamily [Arabidopsis thaliana]
MGVIDMVLFWVLLVNALLIVDASSRNMPFAYQNEMQRHCSSTKYTSLCVQNLREFRHGSLDGLDFVSFLVNKTISDSNLLIPPLSSSMGSSKLVSLEDSTYTLPSPSVSDSCERLMKMSTRRLRQAMEALNGSSRKRHTKHDVQTWLSAAMTFQQACKDSILDSGGSSSASAISHISQKMDHLSRLVSNSLTLVDTIMKNPKPKTKSTALPRWVTAGERRLLVGRARAHVVVAKDGSGDYRTVMEAVTAAHGNGKDLTVIVGDDSATGGTSVPDTATMTVTGDGFIARDIGIKNIAGPRGHQAIALSITSDQSVLYRCSISGYQDTLYAAALRQFYRECDIYGTIDFIFGNAAAVFQSCNIFLRRPHGVKAYNVILANGRTDQRQNTGFALHSCRIRTDSDLSPVKHKYSSYLGRPWRKYSRAIVMESYIDDAIAEGGWAGWLDSGDEVLKTLYFGEFKNYGPKARISKRVTWEGFHSIGFEEANYFSVVKRRNGEDVTNGFKYKFKIKIQI